MFGISGGEILIILLAVLVLFGPKKIPEIARMLGRGINEVKKVQREINTEIHRYSADMEQEARKIQDSIDEMKQGMKVPVEGLAEGSPSGQAPITDSGTSQQGESKGDAARGQAEQEEDLPYPYNQKTGEGP
ncbi:MAG: hypothetical protein GX168_01770 [Bacteroidales bacterium]|nr:hypothetical protein [Bacteroidales bacterium]